MKQHVCLEKLAIVLFSGAQGTNGRNVEGDRQENRSRQVIKSLGWHVNGFELHPKTFGMSLTYFKQGREILRSDLHFMIAVWQSNTELEHAGSQPPCLLQFSPHTCSLVSELCLQNGPWCLGLWAFACVMISSWNMLFLLTVLLGKNLLVANGRKPTQTGLSH